MRYKNLYLHNITEVLETKDYTQFFRFPNHLKPFLESSGEVNEVLHGSEIRFLIKGPTQITLKSLSDPVMVTVYYGDFQESSHLIYKEPTTIDLDLPFSKPWFDVINKEDTAFDSQLVRIILYEKIAFCDIQGHYEYPDLKTMPKQKMLSYGTSITQGRRSFYPDISYPFIFARNIKADVDNLAMSGSCLIEEKYVDFILSKSYDIITLCLSTNMLGKGYDPEVFRKRITYLFNAIKKTNPNAIVIILNLLTSYRDLGLIKTDMKNTENRHVYRKIMNDVASLYSRFYVLDGKELLSINNLTNDLLHPGHFGMMEIAEKLTSFYKETILKK